MKRFTAGDSEVAVFEFQGRLRDLMVSSLRESYLATGNYVSDAKALSPQSARSLAFSSAAAVTGGTSAALSGTLYVATAAPSTLMQLGSGGFSSAIMGAQGIVGHAGFIPVASALPVLAPIMMMQALQTHIMLKQFEQVDQKLDAIKSTLDQVLARTEATHAGELLTASFVVDEIYAQYNESGGFSTDMLLRLALAERDVRRLAERFRYLVGANPVTEFTEFADVQRANYDVHSAMLASFLDLRVANLRVNVDMQENPKSVNSSVERLKDKVRDLTAYWQQVLERSHALGEALKEGEAKLEDMSFVKKFVRGGQAEKEIDALKDAYLSTLASEKALMEGFLPLIESAKRTLSALTTPPHDLSGAPTLVYWKDENGEHSFSSNQLQLT